MVKRKKKDGPEQWWTTNEYGHWCPSCGELLSSESDWEGTYGDCKTCGYPEDGERMAEYFTGEDE